MFGLLGKSERVWKEQRSWPLISKIPGNTYFFIVPFYSLFSKNDEMQYALDAPFISRQVTVTGFSRQSHAFFVGSSTQPNEPIITARLGDENISFVKISR